MERAKFISITNGICGDKIVSCGEILDWTRKFGGKFVHFGRKHLGLGHWLNLWHSLTVKKRVKFWKDFLVGKLYIFVERENCLEKKKCRQFKIWSIRTSFPKLHNGWGNIYGYICSLLDLFGNYWFRKAKTEDEDEGFLQWRRFPNFTWPFQPNGTLKIFPI